MKINQKVKIANVLLFLLLLNVPLLWAQVDSFRYKAAVQKVNSDGIYRIMLQPELTAKSAGEGLSDIRLKDEAAKDVAYASGNDLPPAKKTAFIEFPEIKQSADTANVYIAENKEKRSIGNLWLKIKNTVVSRSVNLAGSDDLVHWFAIKEDIGLQESNTASETDYEQSLNFPPANYRYFKVYINSKHKDFIKITRCGVYILPKFEPEYIGLPAIKFDTKGVKKTSSVYIDLGDRYLIDKLHIKISTPKYYDRRIIVYDIQTKLHLQLCDTSISSSGSQNITLTAKTNKLKIDIFNADDNPLNIETITAYQLKRFIIGYLQAGHNYYLSTGNSLALQPRYDLSFLRSALLDSLPVVNHTPVFENPGYHKVSPAPKHDFSILLWVAIIMVLLILSWLTFKMVREINTKGD
ncbi:MAG: hypothetical protein ABI203_02265 [Mucilaginibacter sp.]